MKHIMFDLETLATTSDAVIMSIGAVKFDLDSTRIDDNGFYASVSVESNLDLKRRISESTLTWWMSQDIAAKAVFVEAKQTLRAALEELTNWMSDDVDYTVWSNGADFDLPMLAHAYTQCGLDIPWAYPKGRCFRTYKNLPGAKAIRIPPAGTKHNALSDAHQQAATLQAIHKALFIDRAHAMVNV